jgi:putative ABC transport system permease protein
LVRPINPGGTPFDQSAGPRFYVPDEPRIVCFARGVCTKVDADPGPPPGEAIELRLVAMTGDIRQFKAYRLESGQWLDFASGPSMAPRIVLNKEAAKGLTRHRVPAEMRVDGAIANMTPQIVGVVDDGAAEPVAYVRMDELLNWFAPADANRRLGGGGLEVLRSPDATAIDQVLRTRLTASGVPAEQLRAEPIRSLKTIEARLALLRWIFLGMAGLVLLIGVAGILNVGLATVGERVEEFALRRAVGTPRLLLAGIVLVETLLTGLFTAGAAIGVAALGLRYAGRFIGGRVPALANMDFPWQAGLAGIIAGLVAGLLGGLVPAIRAARIPIATVMRA